MAQSCLLLGTAFPHTATTASHSLLPRPYLRAWRRAHPQPDRAASGWGRSARPARRTRASHAPSSTAADAIAQPSQPKGLWSSAVTQDAAARVEAALANAMERALAGWPAGAAPELAVVFVSSAFQVSGACSFDSNLLGATSHPTLCVCPKRKPAPEPTLLPGARAAGMCPTVRPHLQVSGLTAAAAGARCPRLQREYERVLPVLRGMVPSLRHIVGCSVRGALLPGAQSAIQHLCIAAMATRYCLSRNTCSTHVTQCVCRGHF